MTKITVIIPTFNEESNIQRALESVAFADEIIVIDSFSTDKTVEIVNNSKVKLIKRKFDDFSRQKNYAIQQASNDWVLIVDADEEVTKELREEIISRLSQKIEHVAFYVRRRNYIIDKKLNFGGYFNKIIRLFKKGNCFYQGIVHEKIIAKGSLGALKGTINHYTYRSYDQFKSKMDYYAKLRAKELFVKGKKVTFFHLYIKPITRFGIHYFIKLGFLDGKEGLAFSYLMAYGVAKRFKELTLLKNEK